MKDQLSIVSRLYSKFKEKHEQARAHFGRPLTLTQKILSSHMKRIENEEGATIVPGNSYAHLYPDRVAMQDATAQMALLQFTSAKKNHVAVPSTVHCDHLIEAHYGANRDLEQASISNKEVYDFLRTASAKYGIGFFKPGSGIIHQVVLENFAFPGGMLIGTDSHTPNAGGLGMIAIGVGGADAVDVMVGGPLQLKWPKVIGVHLKGKLKDWTSPKDIILKLMGILSVKGGTGHIVEFFGEGAQHISATGKGTITNMGAEHGATCSIFPYDHSMSEYLAATGRAQIAQLADQYAEFLRADPEVYQQPEHYYDRVIEIDLNTLSPHIVGPHSPDLCRPLSALKDEIKEKNYVNELSAALIGSCTNSSYEDIGRAASIATEANKLGLKAKIPFYITPGSETVYQTVSKAGFLEPLQQIGGTVLANACGPCIGQWARDDIKKGEINSIVSSYNRNFPGRNDGNRETLSFLSSPEVVVAMALSGKLEFDPEKDTLTTPDQKSVRLSIPHSPALPKEGFDLQSSGFIKPPHDGSQIEIAIDKNSERLALLTPFVPWDGKDFIDMPVLLKAKGKCTTDHISQAGPWLKYRGHLDKISNNTYIGAINAFTSTPGTGLNVVEKSSQEIILPDLAREYKAKNIGWTVIGDENFGEGSSREHAAMQPRHLGCKAIIARSFARIHETNLKKQGILPLTFNDKNDYEKIKADDRISIVSLAELSVGNNVKVKIQHSDGSIEEILTNHTMSPAQIEWFKAGSALNHLAKNC
ncbi:MAG: aconitate hydratase [Myxococcales bacterium]|nr:aconitate hydratase [Myxococcales bacterium]USN51362.1 MAG: aconitate hydratase [Myxococcales bacterium]